MPRARRVFEAARIKVIPFPVDFQIGVYNSTFIDFIPTAEAFWRTSFSVREIIGRVFRVGRDINL